MVQNCLQAHTLLASLGIQVTVADARFYKPLDIKLVSQLCEEHSFLVTVEEGSVGGFGSHVAQFIALDEKLDGRIKIIFRPRQTLADFAVLIRSLKQNLSSEASPVVIFVGSYGGMLAAWFRLKYPHIAIGALASSAPILQFDDITPWTSFYDAVSQDYKDVSLNCYEVIKGSWSELKANANTERGDITTTFEEETTRVEILSLKNALKFFDADFFSESKVGEMAKDAKDSTFLFIDQIGNLLHLRMEGYMIRLYWSLILSGVAAKNTENKKIRLSICSSIQMPDREENIAVLSVFELGHLIRTKQITSHELTGIFLRRMKKYDVALEAVVSYTEDLAYKQAKEADNPLHGIPYGLKDIIAVPHYKTTWGSTTFMNQVLDIEAWIYKRLRSAGAVLIVKLVSGSLAYDDI
ncbi:hypothetical protein GIB67_015674 [Kingdonia uniflora]|uniref:Uncharacterized protein n=1 Tax=Kingdonia uniflora TaxID=39325 RepID=A0A7J7NUR7_9MAGN|nr:hypothetical protein GIB67_015674 [Kingdonia uniflora]